MKYKIFTNDRGPHAYSCFAETSSRISFEDAKELARRRTEGLPTDGYPLRVLVVPEDRIHELPENCKISPAQAKEFLA